MMTDLEAVAESAQILRHESLVSSLLEGGGDVIHILDAAKEEGCEFYSIEENCFNCFLRIQKTNRCQLATIAS